MRKRVYTFRLAVAISFGAVLALGACASGVPDELLQERVEAALASASDVPADAITVMVSDGVVTLTGSVVCEECGGRRTPPGFGTVQQSLGAVAHLHGNRSRGYIGRAHPGRLGSRCER